MLKEMDAIGRFLSASKTSSRRNFRSEKGRIGGERCFETWSHILLIASRVNIIITIELNIGVFVIRKQSIHRINR